MIYDFNYLTSDIFKLQSWLYRSKCSPIHCQS